MKHLKLNKFNFALFFVLLIIASLFFLIHSNKLHSDEIDYYHVSKCLINEQSFVCEKTYEYYNDIDKTALLLNNGKYSTIIFPGVSIINTIPLWISHNINLKLGNAPNALNALDEVFAIMNATFISIISVRLIFKTLRRLGFSKNLSLFSIALIVLESFYLYYVFANPMFTHTYEVFAVSLWLFSIVSYKKTTNSLYLKLFFIACGIDLLVRPLPILALGIFALINKKNIKQILSSSLLVLPFLILLGIYNFISYGKILTFGYGVRGEGFSLEHFYGINILFSYHRGLFIYSPILLLSFIGLVLLYRINKQLSILSIITTVFVICTYGFWPIWWGGGGAGSRFLLVLTPIYIIGLATTLKWILGSNKRLKYCFIVFIILTFIYTMLLTFLYKFTDVGGSDFYTPLYFFRTLFKVL